MPVTRSAHAPQVLAGGRLPASDHLVDLVIRDGRISAITPPGGIPAGATVERLEGRTVIPGLWDAHVHATQWAMRQSRLDLGGTRSAREAADTVRAAVVGLSRDQFLVGEGMRIALWQDRPHRDLLDRAVGDIPVVLQNVDLHTVWLNTAALDRMGQPGHPTGLLTESDCFRVIENLPVASTQQQDGRVAMAMTAAASQGITGIKDFEFGDCVGDWQRRMSAHRIDVRVDTTVYPAHLDNAIERGWPTDQVVADSGGMLRAGHLKLFVDGSLNSGTALCHEAPSSSAPVQRCQPRASEPAGRAKPTSGGHGHLETSPAELGRLIARSWRHGIAPAVHAIGDRAVAIALDALEQVGCPGRIEHAQMVATDDLPRFAADGLVASVQPSHAVDDRDIADQRWAGRTHRAYPFADLLAAGAHLEFGSDAPVTALDPWAAIAAAVARSDDDRPAWHPEQRITVAAALTAATRGRDRVRVGDPADLVVVDDDPLTCPIEVLRAVPVWATMLAGHWTHRAE